MGFLKKEIWQKNKKRIILVSAGIAAVAVGCGIWYYVGHNSSEPVYVYPFEYVGMTEYWGDSQESNGPVTTDKIQTVFLSETQTVTEILVKEKDTVKKGDILMTYDTTLSDLQLERKRLDVEKLKLQLESAQKELKRINSLTPMTTASSDTSSAIDPNLGRMIQGAYEISSNKHYDGSSAEKAIICWLKNDTEIDDGLLLDIQNKVSYYQYLNQPEEEPEDTGSDNTVGEEGGTESGGSGNNTPGENTTEQNTPPAGTGEPSSASQLNFPLVSSFHVVFKVTSGNMSLGDVDVWQGMRATDNGSYFTFRPEMVMLDSDHMLVSMGESGYVDTSDVDFGSGYSAAQIAQMRSDQQKKIKNLEFQIKIADSEYRIMQTEVTDGNVYATIDGTVISCLDEKEAKKTKQPVLKISGGGGFYVEGHVSELEKDTMKPGQEVTVNDWNSGMTYTGTIKSIGDFPTRDGYFGGNGNPNASFYPFKVFVDGEADLQEGSYVSVAYASAESQDGIYLENPFLRTENGKSYVLVKGADGKLEQRYVTTGKSLWGSYVQILDGLTAEDLVAFPYGKNVKPGVAVVEGDFSNLYG